ncbi:Hypothetical leucine rich repeat protein [Ectocarpus siliculosus]|uniref:non-specific serine/threonine protein kinase n=1 Tax=Ectocarpus siliculosus TaxID=2880 RepID=D7G496_ECTSI|nr:Hypothetical leucine rich repeat protein [Ectocarpus siliculosus]|eukprot:CBJ27111.1 Hypothetical leucine rich repeat protein [Ectocarpus siliculosus]
MQTSVHPRVQRGDMYTCTAVDRSRPTAPVPVYLVSQSSAFRARRAAYGGSPLKTTHDNTGQPFHTRSTSLLGASAPVAKRRLPSRRLPLAERGRGDQGNGRFQLFPATALVQSANCKEKAPFYKMAQTDRKALVALYNATGGVKWKNNQNWNTSAALSQWYRVEVNSQGRVVKLSLWNNNLQGPIPVEVGRLAVLEYLDLRANELTGAIPPEVGKLTALRWLNLRSNQLSGPIPPQLGDLSTLEILDLSWNKLDGNIPTELGDLRQLQLLLLNENHLTGAIPAQLGALNKLTRLDLSINQLSGPIPPELGELEALKSLYLSNNQLAGNIPPELGDLRQLQWLRLSENHLTGTYFIVMVGLVFSSIDP